MFDNRLLSIYNKVMNMMMLNNYFELLFLLYLPLKVLAEVPDPECKHCSNSRWACNKASACTNGV